MTDRRGEGEGSTHDLLTGWRKSPLPNSIPKFQDFCNFQDGWQFLEISTRACNAPSPNLNLSLNFSLDSVLFLVLLLVPLLLFVVVLMLVSVLILV